MFQSISLGFLELALALKFASNADLVVQAGILTREVFVGLWIVIFALLTMYLLGMFKTSHDSDLKHVSVGRLFVAIASFFITIYLIPGMWGAPLKLFSGILPPLEYSESPHGFGGSAGSSVESVIPRDAEFGKFMEVNKNGIVHFKNDYFFTAFNASVNSGTTLKRSPTNPTSATSKIGASASLLIATITLLSFIPAKC